MWSTEIVFYKLLAEAVVCFFITDLILLLNFETVTFRHCLESHFDIFLLEFVLTVYRIFYIVMPPHSVSE